MEAEVEVERVVGNLAARRCEVGTNPEFMRLGAGDGTRTRDALLGRQVLTFSPPASRKAPSIQHFSPQYIIRPKTRQLPRVSGTSCHGMCSHCNRGSSVLQLDPIHG